MASISSSSLTSKTGVNFLSTYLPHQPWSLPDSIIYYITKKPSSSKAYQKLIHSCKYFFVKNPILVIGKFYYSDFNKQWYSGFTKYRQSFDFTNASIKIWITVESNVSSLSNSKFLSSIIPKFYQFDVTKLQIFYQNITMNELLFVARNVEDINFCTTTVTAENGTIVPLERIIAALPKLEKIQFRDVVGASSITKNTVKEFLKIPHFAKLKFFYILNIPQIFDIEMFFSYIKKNQFTRIYVEFNYSISNAYKNRLEEIIDENIAAENREYKLPFIKFPGINRERFYKMYRLFYNSDL